MKKQNNSNNSLRKNSVSLMGALAMSAAFMGHPLLSSCLKFIYEYTRIEVLIGLFSNYQAP